MTESFPAWWNPSGVVRMTYRLIVWDFDGTLANTLPGGVAIFNELANEHGFRPIANVADARSMTTWQLLRRQQVPLFRLPRLMRELIRRQHGRLGEVALFQELPGLLRELDRRGVALGVVSSNAEENIRGCLAAHGLESLFQFVAGSVRLFGKKHSLRRMLRSRRIPVADCLYIGDEVRDVQAARGVGIDVAAVTWGFQHPDLLAAQLPTYLLHHPTDLLDVLTARAVS